MSVQCPHCSREFNKGRVDPRHLRVCSQPADPSVEPCLCRFRAKTHKLMKIHRRTCEVWQSRDKKAVQEERLRATSLKRYGVEDCRHSPEANAKKARTNLEKYGAENPFCREASTFEKVQASLEGKRPVFTGEDCAFSKPEVQEKIRSTMFERYGFENPQQVPEIRARTSDTCGERYGGVFRASPVIDGKSRETNRERYGDEFPQRTSEVKERTQTTNMERYGVPWTCMDSEVRRKQLETHHERYGSHFFASDEGKESIRQALLEKYGVDHWMKTPGAWEKIVQVFQERYGVDHPLQLAEFLEKRVETNLAWYGVEHVLRDAEICAKMVSTKIERYGNPWGPSPADGPNGLERLVQSLAPSLVFTGDFTFWRWLPTLNKHKNPDFIVPGPDPAHPKRGVTKVVEAFGDYWHSRMFTARAPFEHEQELIDAYQEADIECLVIWESEVKAEPEEVRERLSTFLG